jgi:hypothetical protein
MQTTIFRSNSLPPKVGGATTGTTGAYQFQVLALDQTRIRCWAMRWPSRISNIGRPASAVRWGSNLTGAWLHPSVSFRVMRSLLWGEVGDRKQAALGASVYFGIIRKLT